MLTGLLAFRSKDPMELVHAHIARIPEAPHTLFADIPRAVSDIVMKLLAKTVEERYQSAYGLQMDLLECLRQLKENRKIEDFPPGARDISDRLQVPQKLYGRGVEIEILLEAFERARQGAAELMLVTGYSGIGKSALVNEIHKPIAKHRGYFIQGKFDQFKRNIPYSALIQAFRNLVRDLLTESAKSIDAWKIKLLDSLGDNAQLIVEAIPELELITGRQNAVPELPAAEAQNRFTNAFQRFIGVFARPEHPIAIFLDDLQWADSSTLHLIRLLCTHRNSKHLLFIGAYRDNEVDSHHPLILAVAEIKASNAPTSDIHLAPLMPDTIGELLGDTLRMPPADLADLIELVFRKTAGNPFFVNEFLRSLAEDGLLRFDHESGHWQWDVQAIGARAITDNVVELMAGKIQKLDSHTRQILQIGSCLGNSFNLKSLALAHARSPRETASALWPALSAGLLQPRGNAYRRAANSDDDGADVSYSFSHDRVQQAAYGMIPEAQRALLHLQIGRLLLQEASVREHDLAEGLFEITQQLNRGLACIEDPAEKLRFAELNLTAGRRARDSAAFESARSLLLSGASLLPANAWEAYYPLTLALNTELSECEFLCRNYEAAEKLYAAILTKAKTRSDKAKVYEVQIAQYVQQGRTEDALIIGTRALKLYGVSYSHRPGLPRVLINLLRVKLQLAGKKIEDLIDAPEIQDPDQVVAMQILANMSSPAYFYSQEAILLLLFRILQISLKHGNAPVSAYAYAIFGFVEAVKLHNPRGARRFVELAIAMNRKYNDIVFRCKILFTTGHFIRHWYEPAPLALPTLKSAYDAGLGSGDFNFACYALHGVTLREIYLGFELNDVYRRACDYSEFVDKTREQAMLQNFAVMRRFLCGLIETAADDPWAARSAVLEEAEFLKQQRAIRSDMGTSWWFGFGTIGAYLHGQYDEAWRMACETRKCIDDASIGMLLVPEFYFYYTLLCCALYERDRRRRYRVRAGSSLRRLRRLARDVPENFEARYILARAEYDRVIRRDEAAADGFEQAIAAANSQNAVQLVALASELAGRYYLQRGRLTVAGLYLRNARYGYLRWGAGQLVQRMDRDYAVVLQSAAPRTAGTAAYSTSMNTYAGTDPSGQTNHTRHYAPTESTETGTTFSGRLDLDTVLKASQTISGEIKLERLLGELMRIVLENAGASRGLLILKRDDALFIEGESEIDQPEATRVAASIPLETGSDAGYAVAAINYSARTREYIVLDDAANAGSFTSDPYIARVRLKSLLCLPLIHQGEFAGLLYLENNLTTGAFTPDRLRILQLLTSQIVISINNANFFARVQTMANAFERFVPRQFLDSLGKTRIEEIQLGDAVVKELTVLFSDIRGFTNISETMSVSENFAFLNAYLNRMSPAINNNHGFVDKFIGDAIMALFPRKPEGAVRAAIEMLFELKQFNHQIAAQHGHAPIQIGIGLHTGESMLGTVGSENRLETTVIGDSVNLASRIESLTKLYRVPALITGAVYRALEKPGEYHLREIDAVRVRGKNIPVVIYELFDVDHPDLREQKLAIQDDFRDALLLYKAGEFPRAGQLFRDCLGRCPADPISAIYVERCQTFSENPPTGPHWDAVANIV
jgi:predicted ATPase/class 3 adenylate cyclase